ncbi:unnamed protein product, partial [Prorocentrum cordatum]
ALRVALGAHWRIGDTLGCHFPSFGEGLAADRLLGCPGAVVKQAEEALALGNQARHAPPPSAAGGTLPREFGVQASDLEAQLKVQAFSLRGEAAPLTPASRGTVDVLLEQLGGGDCARADGCKAESQKHTLKVKVQKEPKVVAECCHDDDSVKEAPPQMSVGFACQVVVHQKLVEICVAVECNVVEYQQRPFVQRRAQLLSVGVGSFDKEGSHSESEDSETVEEEEPEAERIFNMAFRDGVEIAEVVQHIEAARFDLMLMGDFF